MNQRPIWRHGSRRVCHGGVDHAPGERLHGAGLSTDAGADDPRRRGWRAGLELGKLILLGGGVYLATALLLGVRPGQLKTVSEG